MNRTLFGLWLLFLLSFGLASVAGAQSTSSAASIALWPDGLPNDNGLSGEETIGHCTGNISVPALTVYLPTPEQATGAAILVTPGGGYQVVCDDLEGKQIAEILVPRGIATIVLKYRLPNKHHEIPAGDARQAMRVIRHHTSEWNIDPNKVGIWGFSAGGHLASTVSNVFVPAQSDHSDPLQHHSSRPDFSILFYPVISMENGVTHTGSRNSLLGPNPSLELVRRYCSEKQISNQTPPTFLLHATDDRAVPVENSLRYFRTLIEHGVSAQLLIFELGGHGPSAFRENPSWLPSLEDWLKRRGVL